MAHVKKGLLTTPGKWWKHFRQLKRAFWKTERQAAKKLAQRRSENGGA